MRTARGFLIAAVLAIMGSPLFPLLLHASEGIHGGPP
jgi:hypothetical protein